MLLDIELQFVERVVPAPEFGEDIGKTVRILQSRKLVCRGGPYRPEWTDWADVPFEPIPPQAPGLPPQGEA